MLLVVCYMFNILGIHQAGFVWVDEIRLAQHIIEVFRGFATEKRPFSDQINGYLVFIGFHSECFIESKDRNTTLVSFIVQATRGCYIQY